MAKKGAGGRRPNKVACRKCGHDAFLINCGVDEHSFMGRNLITGETNKAYREFMKSMNIEPCNGRVYQCFNDFCGDVFD